MKKNYLVIVLVVLCFTTQIVIAQRVGFNDDGSPPAASAALDIKSTTKGFLLPRLTSQQRVLVAQPANGLMVYDSDADHIYTYNTGQGWSRLLSTDYWSLINGVSYNASDSIGIGTSVPAEKLHVANGNLKISNGDLVLKRTTGQLQKIDFDFTSGGSNGYVHGIDYFVGSGLRKGFISYTHSNSAGEAVLKLAPSGGSSLSLKSSGNFIFNATVDPTIQLQSAGIGTGFMQVAGNDVRMGTNSGNSSGKFVVRTNGADRMFVTAAGRVGIGEPNPEEMLDINGNMYALGTIAVNNKLVADNIEISGTISRPTNNSIAALTPLCYGSVYADGTINSATPNVTINRYASGYYLIKCSGIDANCMILVTAANERHVCHAFFDTYDNIPGEAKVRITRDNSTSPPSGSNSDFCFVIYKM